MMTLNHFTSLMFFVAAAYWLIISVMTMNVNGDGRISILTFVLFIAFEFIAIYLIW